MSLEGVKCKRGYITLADHRECMLQPNHPCGLSEDVLEIMTGSNAERESSGVKFSPSTLMSCDRQGVLQGEHGWYVDVEGIAWAQTRGNMLHALMEKQPTWPGVIGTVRELRMKQAVNTKYGEQVFMGKADLIVLKHMEGSTMHVKVVDYKTKSEILHGPLTPLLDARVLPGHASSERKHQMQVNLYAWLAEQTLANVLNTAFGWEGNSATLDGVDISTNIERIPYIDAVVVDELEIVYADMKKSRRFTSHGELITKGKRISMSPLTYEDLILDPIYKMKRGAVRSWIIKHIEQKIDAEKSLPAPLTGSGAKQMCFFCPVRKMCVDIGLKEGYSMEEQL